MANDPTVTDGPADGSDATVIFDTDPFIGCPFDKSELEIVQEAEGFQVGEVVGVHDVDTWKLGVIEHIGIKAKYWAEGSPYFTVIIVKTQESGGYMKASKHVKKMTEFTQQCATFTPKATEIPLRRR